MMRLLWFPLLGALVAVLVMAGVQLMLLGGAGGAGEALPWPVLLEAMDLLRYAVLGALVGAVFAPWGSRVDRPVTGALRWLLAAPLVAGLAPLVDLAARLGHVPALAELAAGYAVRTGDGIAAFAAALACAGGELAGVVAARRRLRREARIHVAADSRADAVLAEDREARARRYLESKRQSANRS